MGSLLLRGEPPEPGISQVIHSYHYDCQLDAGAPCDVGKCTCIYYGDGHYFFSRHLARLKHLTLFVKLSQLSVCIYMFMYEYMYVSGGMHAYIYIYMYMQAKAKSSCQVSSSIALGFIFGNRVCQYLLLMFQLDGWPTSSRNPPLSSSELEGRVYAAASGLFSPFPSGD